MKYKVILSSGPDMVIQKKSRTYIKDLVLMFSQNLFYVLDETNNIKEEIIDENNLKNFFKELTSYQIAIPKGAFTFYGSDLRKNELKPLFLFISNSRSNKGLNYCLRKNLIKMTDICDFRKDAYKINTLYKEDPKILKVLAGYTNILQLDDREVNFVRTIYGSFGYETFKKIYQYGIMPHYFCKSVVDLKPYNLNPARFTQYLTESMMCEECNMDLYFDYLNIASQNGSIKEKYPEYITTAHDKYTTILNENRDMQCEYPEFSSIMSECEDYTFEAPRQKFCIVMPKESKDIVNEGMSLGHCVSSYVPKIIAGDCIILFMREKNSKDIPYLTVEISKGKRLTEVEGANKRTKLTDEEKTFLNLFAKEKGILVEAHNVQESKGIAAVSAA